MMMWLQQKCIEVHAQPAANLLLQSHPHAGGDVGAVGSRLLPTTQPRGRYDKPRGLRTVSLVLIKLLHMCNIQTTGFGIQECQRAHHEKLGQAGSSERFCGGGGGGVQFTPVSKPRHGRHAVVSRLKNLS